MKKGKNTAITKLIKQSLRYNKKRNFFIVFTIILTSFMIASVFSIGMGYYESIKMQEKRLEGSLAQVAIGSPTDEQMQILQELDYVKHVGIAHAVGETYDIPKLGKLLLAYVNDVQWEEMFVPTFTNVEGNYPKQRNEIMLSRHILEAMGMENAKIGMEIPLKVDIYGTDEQVLEVFILSGIHTEFSHVNGGFVAAYTSYELAKEYGVVASDNTTVNIMFRDEKNEDYYIQQLKNDLNIEKQQNGIQVASFEVVQVDTTLYIIFGVIIVFLMLTGYLLIYNVMYISIANDVRFYGMIKAIGMTSKQIRQMVKGQITILFAAGVSIGIILAIIVSLILIPLIINNSGVQTGAVVSFSPYIYVGTIVFTGITVYLGVSLPIKISMNVSPVEALKYVGELDEGQRKYLPFKGKLSRLAFINLLRTKKQSSYVIMSLFMGIIVFKIVLTIVDSWDIERRIQANFTHDFLISASQQATLPYLNEDFVNNISTLQGVTQVNIRTLEEGKLNYKKELDSYIEEMYNTILGERTNIEEILANEKMTGKLLGIGLRGMDTQELRQICDGQSQIIDFDAFERGEVLLINSNNMDLSIIEQSFKTGSIMDITIGSSNTMYSMEIGGYIKINPPATGFVVSRGTEVIVSNEVIKDFFESPCIASVGVNVESKYEKQICNYLKDMLTSGEKMISRYEARKSMENNRIIIYVLGGGMASILALIGIFNFINVVSVKIISRKRELAILQTIGMSKRQVIQLLRCEGLLYGIITIFCSSTIGIMIVWGIFSAFKNIEPTAIFEYPLTHTLIIYSIILFVCAVVPSISYKRICKEELTVRMKQLD